MVAPLIPIVAAGVAARYGAKKLAKHLVKQSIKKSKGKDAINKAKRIKKDDQIRQVIKDSDGTRFANTDKVSIKKLYRGSREPDGSYTDPGNKILRKQFGVNIGRRPIGKTPKAKTTGFAAGEKLTRAKNAAKIAGKMSPY